MHRVTRAACLGLLLTFVAAQAVSLADCCCGSFCRHKNTCTGCEPGDPCPGREHRTEKSSCCGPEESAPKKACAHFEPSSEIDSDSADAPHPPPLILVDLLPIDLPSAVLPERILPSVDTGPPRAGPPGALPLHLFLSVLRI